MVDIPWADEFPGAIIITDLTGKIIYLNRQAARQEGGDELLGQQLEDCHSEKSRQKIKEIMESKKPNVYTIEKLGQKKLIYQTVWTKKGEVAGLLELSLPIPFELPHFVRD